MLPPAAEPRLNPTLQPSGFRAAVRSRLPKLISSMRSARSAAVSSSRSETSRNGTARRCPGL